MDNYIILGHENPDVDSIVSGYLLEKIMIKLGYNASFLIPDRAIEKETIDSKKNIPCPFCNNEAM